METGGERLLLSSLHLSSCRVGFIVLAAALSAVPVFRSSILFAQETDVIEDSVRSHDVATTLAARDFQEIIASAIVENPQIAERRAYRAEAEAAKRESQASLFPTIDLAVSANRALAREFSNDPDNLIERARGPGRADVSASINQTLFDFGASSQRTAATSSRIEAAQADIDAAQETLALRAIGAWIDVAVYTRLVYLAETHLASQTAYRVKLQSRIEQGISAPADHARLEAAIATSEQRIASFSQELSNAAARFREIFGAQVTQPTQRPPTFELTDPDIEEIILASQNTASVRSAKAQAKGAQDDARAARSDTLPNVRVSIDAGRYGIFEQDRSDYDLRARVTLSYRFFGPADARADQAAARASAALSRSDATFREAEREARTAVSDVKALTRISAAFDAEFRASRITRDAEIARFRIAGGTMFDVLRAEDRYFNSAVNYLRSTSEIDAARYVLLARVGLLLPALGITPDYASLGHQ